MTATGLPVTNLSTGATVSNAGGIEGLDPSDPMGYKGQFGCFTDVETGLVYSQHRYYSPQMGRWLTKDPIGAEGGINVYEVCGNNPIMGADPSGLDGDWPMAQWKHAPPGFRHETPAFWRAVVEDREQRLEYLKKWGSGGMYEDFWPDGSHSTHWPDMPGYDPGLFTHYVGVNATPSGPQPGVSGWPKEAMPMSLLVANAKRVPSLKLRTQWENEFGYYWPKDPATGRNMDAMHIRALADGGTNAADNIAPGTREGHMRNHMENGDFSRWPRMRNALRRIYNPRPDEGELEFDDH